MINKSTNRIITLLLILVLIISCIGCGPAPDNEQNDQDNGSDKLFVSAPSMVVFRTEEDFKEHWKNPPTNSGSPYDELTDYQPLFERCGVPCFTLECGTAQVDDWLSLRPGKPGISLEMSRMLLTTTLWGSNYVTYVVTAKFLTEEDASLYADGSVDKQREIIVKNSARTMEYTKDNPKISYGDAEKNQDPNAVFATTYYEYGTVSVGGEEYPAIIAVVTYYDSHVRKTAIFIKDNYLFDVLVVNDKVTDTLATLDELTIEIVPFEEFIAEDSTEDDGSAENDSSEEGGAAEDNGSEAGATE